MVDRSELHSAMKFQTSATPILVYGQEVENFTWVYRELQELYRTSELKVGGLERYIKPMRI